MPEINFKNLKSLQYSSILLSIIIPVIKFKKLKSLQYSSILLSIKLMKTDSNYTKDIPFIDIK